MLRNKISTWWVGHKRRNTEYWKGRRRECLFFHWWASFLLSIVTVGLYVTNTSILHLLLGVTIPALLVFADALVVRGITRYHSWSNKHKRDAVDYVINIKFVKLCKKYDIDNFCCRDDEHSTASYIEIVEPLLHDDPAAVAMFESEDMQNIREWIKRYWELH